MIALVDVYEGTGIRDGALEFLFHLMEERQAEPEVNISNRGLPSFEHHRQFWTRRPYRFAYLIEPTDYLPRPDLHWPWCGYVSATARNEIGIVVIKAWRGHGLGSAAVQLFMARHYPNPAIPGEVNGHWLANINPANDRSVRMFEKLGFREIQRTFARIEEEDHGSKSSG